MRKWRTREGEPDSGNLLKTTISLGEVIKIGTILVALATAWYHMEGDIRVLTERVQNQSERITYFHGKP